MTDYIERDIWMSLPDDLPYKASVKRVLIQAPAADVRPVVRGQWVSPRPDSEMCSCCGTRFYISALFAVGGNDEPNFCPNCGADMREAGDAE